MTATLTRMNPSPVRASDHLPALDGLRGVAILLVMVFHFLPYDDAPTSLFGRALFLFGACGWCGVDLFFVLSGFLITRILLNQKGRPHFFQNFYARRTLRIFPLYYFVLTVIFVVLPLVAPRLFDTSELIALQHRQGWLWAYAVNVPMTWHNDLELFHGGLLFVAPFWSLAVEEHFYLVWPTIVYFFSRRAMLWACGAGMLGSLLIRVWLWNRRNAWGIYVSTPTRVDTLMIGGAIAVVMQGNREWITRCIGFIRGMPWALGALWLSVNLYDQQRDGLWAVSAGYTLTGIFFASVLLRCVAIPVNRGVLTAKPLRTLGKYSYGLYVYHILLWPSFNYYLGNRHLQDILTRRFHIGTGSYTAGVLLHIAIAGTFSFAAAWLSWQLMEKHFLKLKRYFEYDSNSLHLT